MKLYNFDASDQRKIDLILGFQKDQNPDIFFELLGIFDGYLVHLVRKFQKQYYYLKDVDSQELYHESILSFRKAIVALPENWRPEKIPFWIGSYVKKYFKLRYEKRLKECKVPDYVMLKVQEEQDGQNNNYEKFINKLDIQLILESNILNTKEKEFIQDRYYNNLSVKELAKKHQLSLSGIRKRNTIILKKLKNYLNKSV